MADDLSALTPPFATKELTMPGADVATVVTLPKWCRRFSMRFETNSGKYADTGDDGNPIVADHQTVPGNVLHSLNTDRSGRAGVDTDVVQIRLASPTGGTKCRVTLEIGAT